MHLPNQQKTLAFTLVWVLTGFVSYPTWAQAQPAMLTSSLLMANQGGGKSFVFKPPPRKGTPNRRRGAGPSGPCEAADTNEFLTAVVPKYEGHSLTVDSHPAFWFYIPFQASNFLSMELALWNREEGYYYQTEPMPIRQGPGVVSVLLPSQEEGLKIDQKYTWRFIVKCQDPEQTSGTPTIFLVSGSIERIKPSAELERKLGAASTERDKGIAYAQNGIWFDALTILGNLRRNNPRNPSLDDDWSSLLDSIGLNDIAPKPIL